MKKISIFICFTFFIFFMLISINNIDVFALSVSEIKNRNECNTLNYELAIANSDGSLSTRSCHESYDLAKTEMDSATGDDIDNLVILERKNDITMIIDAKYALVDYDQKVSIITNLYKNLGDTKAYSYITGGSSDDAPLLGFDYNTRRIKIKISGLDCWLDKYDDGGRNQYDIIPLSWVKSTAYYKVSNSSITHVIVSNMFNTGTSTNVTFGPKPTMLNVGNYYSYDGKYFYTDLKLMLTDYKNGNYDNSVNKTTPYYNYYLYLSHRSKSNYTTEDIDNYIENTLGYKSKVSGTLTSTSSMLYGEGASFYEAQELYGTNSLLMFGVARNESGNGRSNLSINKNNLFGHSAVDSDPYAKGDSYQDVKYGIYAHAYKWLSYAFLQPGDYQGRYKGSHVGNKNAGVNVKYASDPYWGEKAAGNYYSFDKTYGLQDYNYYKIGVLNADTVIYPKKTPNGLNVSSKYYKIEVKDTPVLIVGEEKDNNGKTWYKIMSDPMLDSNLEYVGSSTSNPRITYNWDSNYVYVPSEYFYVINDVSIKNPNDIKYDEVVNPDLDNENNNNDINDVPDLPSTDNPASKLQSRDGNLYYFEELSFSSNKVKVSGFMALTGMNNKTSDNISHRIIIKNVDSNIEYVYPLERWLSGVPFEMTNSNESKKYDYSGGWFKGSLDLSNLPQGDYQVFIEVDNSKYKSRTDFNNLFLKDMAGKITLSNNKGLKFSMNFLEKNVPMDLQVRDQGLISSVNPPTIDTMFNSFNVLEFKGNNLHIRGTSHSVDVDYSKSVNVERTIVLEEITTFKRYSYDVGSITDGDYKVTLRASDGKDKTRVWFDAKIDLLNLPKGKYAIYIKTKGKGGEDYGELTDLLFTEINQRTTINGKTMYIRRVENKRLRIELIVE